MVECAFGVEQRRSFASSLNALIKLRKEESAGGMEQRGNLTLPGFAPL
jgi:hypothetical protein